MFPQRNPSKMRQHLLLELQGCEIHIYSWMIVEYIFKFPNKLSTCHYISAFLSPFSLNHPRESQPVVSREDPQCMEQHPDTIALEMITDAEAEPFLALSDVESHRRSAEYKGTKKQLEEPLFREDGWTWGKSWLLKWNWEWLSPNLKLQMFLAMLLHPFVHVHVNVCVAVSVLSPNVSCHLQSHLQSFG